MKNFIKILFVLLIASPLYTMAQEEEVTDPKAREKIEAARIGLISERLGLTPEQAERFWPVYREFTQKRGEMIREFRQAQREIGPDNQDPEKQKELVELGLKIKQRQLDLEKDYSTRMMDVISAQQIMNLRNAEKEFQRMIIRQLQQRRDLQQRKENFRDRNQQLRDRKNNN
jgi:Spy/CpxP family protein refolding chaperone